MQVSDYLEASDKDLQTLFLPTVLEAKALACGVTFQDYKGVYPLKTERDYLQEHEKIVDLGHDVVAETLAQRIGKEQRKQKASIVRVLSSLGLYETAEMLEQVANELYFLQKTDFEAYQQKMKALHFEAEMKKEAARRQWRETIFKRRQARQLKDLTKSKVSRRGKR
jgi:hypothetical protein